MVGWKIWLGARCPSNGLVRGRTSHNGVATFRGLEVDELEVW